MRRGHPSFLFAASLAVLAGCTLNTPVTTGTVTPPSSSAASTGSRIGEAWDTTTLTPGSGSRLTPDAPASSTAPEDLDRSSATFSTDTAVEDAPAAASPEPSITVDTAHAVVPSAPDGDTIHAVVDGIQYTVRIIGIDTPETVDPRKPIQCFGPQASARTKGTLTGQVVTLTPDPTQGDKDRNDRLLRYVDLADGTDWGAELIKEGMAHEYRYKTVYQRRATYLALQDQARQSGTGGWAPTGTGGGCGW